MAREKLLFIIGILSMLIPNMGFSETMEKIIFLVFGVIVILISYGIYFDKRRRINSNETNSRTS